MRRKCYVAVFVTCLTVVLASLAYAQQANPGEDQEYSQDQINATSADVFLERMATPEPGYHRFAAMWALGKKAQQADATARWQMLKLVTTAMHDKSRSEYQRFQCCYVISDCGDDKWVPQLVYVLLNDPSVTMRSVAAEALGKFKNCTAARDGLVKASGQEKNDKVLEIIQRSLAQGKSIPAAAFLEKMVKPEPGYHQYAAMWALGEKAKGSSGDVRKAIMTLVVTAMNDKSRAEGPRWQCCYVISDCGDEAWVPSLVDVLTNDTSFILRSVAAEALAKFPNCAAAHEALVHAQGNETDQRVLDTINRVLEKANAGT